MADIFVSYSRKNTAFVEKLFGALKAIDREAWVDWQEIHYSEDWWQKICAGIEAADNFVFVMTPDSVRSKPCFDEIEHAVKHNKRLVPILLQDITEQSDKEGMHLHPAIRRHHWLPFLDESTFDASLAELITVIDQEPEHVKTHTRILVRAKDWKASGEKPSLLLRGDDLAAAETWLAQGAEKSPLPTDLHKAFIAASRREEDQIQRQTRNLRRATIIFALVGVVAAAVGVIFTNRAIVAEAREREANTQAAVAVTSVANAIALRETVEFGATAFSVQQVRAGTWVAALGSMPQFEATLSPHEVISEATLAATRQFWTPVVQSFEDVEMVRVPAGCFWMGDNYDSDTRPIHHICFDSDFWIDRFEVTNAQFDAKGGVAALPSRWSQPQYPRTDISWSEARDYCAARAARLPTEPEWEYAARGPNSLRNPWGNELDLDKLAYGGNEPQPVGQYPEGVSWVGAYDMSGNVWERVSSLYLPFPYDPETHESEEGASVPRVIKGGAFDAVYPIANRDPDYPYLPIGFRCARTDE